MINKALEWVRKKKAEGYVPKFKQGDTIFAKNGEFTLLAKVEHVNKREGSQKFDAFVGEYTLRYLVNNMTTNLKWSKRKDIRAIDSKYNLCENPEVFKVLYSKGEQDERTEI